MLIRCGAKCCSSRGALGHEHQRRVIAVLAAPVEDAKKPQQRTSRVIETLGSREVCFLNDDGEIEQIDANVDDHTNRTVTQRVKDYASDLLLPDGYPKTLTPDYLPYQMWTLPVHITGWISNSLVTSSLLKAAGLGTGAAGTVAAGAAIKWITKDGIGALGRVLVGSSLARYFDEDPRFWRLMADVIKAGGQALEVATAASPSLFVLLAGTGNFAKAAGKGIGRPAFRVIQNHFATHGNVGDVAAREEIWEVIAQLVGLAASVALLQALDSATSSGSDAGVTVIGTWALVQAAHLALRYKALSVLELPWISQRRAVTLCTAFVRGEPLPEVRTVCRAEQFAVPKQTQRPFVLMNATLSQVADAAAALPFRTCSDAHSACPSPAATAPKSNGTAGNGSATALDEHAAVEPPRPRGAANLCAALDMYGDDDFVLLPVLERGPAESTSSCDDGTECAGSAVAQAEGPGRGNGAVQGADSSGPGASGEASFVMAVKVGCDERSTAKVLGVLQAVWLHQHRGQYMEGPEGSLAALAAAQEWVRAERPRFEAELQAAGWDGRVAMWSRQRCVLAVDALA